MPKDTSLRSCSSLRRKYSFQLMRIESIIWEIDHTRRRRIMEKVFSIHVYDADDSIELAPKERIIIKNSRTSKSTTAPNEASALRIIEAEKANVSLSNKLTQQACSLITKVGTARQRSEAKNNPNQKRRHHANNQTTSCPKHSGKFIQAKQLPKS